MIIDNKTGRALAIDGSGNIVGIALTKTPTADGRGVDYGIASKRHAAELKSGAIRFATDADVKSAADTETKRAAKERAEAEAAAKVARAAQDKADAAEKASGGPIKS